MKNRGFTLIELLAVITILAIILTITFATINNVLEESRENTYDSQVANIENAAKRYISDNIQTLDENGNLLISKEKENIILINTLKSDGYLNSQKDIQNTKTGNSMTGCVVVDYANTYNQFQYLYTDYECVNTNDLTPKITFTNQVGTTKYDVNIDYPDKSNVMQGISYVYRLSTDDNDIVVDTDVTAGLTVDKDTKVTAEIQKEESVIRQITEIAG